MKEERKTHLALLPDTRNSGIYRLSPAVLKVPFNWVRGEIWYQGIRGDSPKTISELVLSAETNMVLCRLFAYSQKMGEWVGVSLERFSSDFLEAVSQMRVGGKIQWEVGDCHHFLEKALCVLVWLGYCQIHYHPRDGEHPDRVIVLTEKLSHHILPFPRS